MHFILPAYQPIIVAGAHHVDGTWVPTHRASVERVIDLVISDSSVVDPDFLAQAVAAYSVDGKAARLADGTIRLRFAEPSVAENALHAIRTWLTGMKKNHAVTLSLLAPTTSVCKAMDSVRGVATGEADGMRTLTAQPRGWHGVVEYAEDGVTVVRVVLTPA